MAAFLGTRETMQPRSARQHHRGKRGRAKDGAENTETATDDQGSRSVLDVKLEPPSETVISDHVAKKKRKVNNTASSVQESVPIQAVKKHVDSDEDGLGNDDSASAKFVAKQEVDWKPSEVLTLLDQIQNALPNDENIKYSTMADKLEWEKVKVGSHTPQECKEQWLIITTKLRRFRTMSELVVDAKEWAKHPWNAFGKKVVKHPEMPKKPLTPYFRFFMRKRVAYAKKHPDMSVTELTKELSKKYGSLPEHKKQKYIDSYNRDMEDWKAQMIKFRQAHPEMFADESPGSASSNALSKQLGFVSVPPKTITAMQIYINEKCEEDQKKGSKVTRKELYEKYKTAWQTLAENKKLKYIKLAIEAKKKYDEDMEKYCAEHPEFQPRVVKTFLSKAEQKLKDRIDGKPEKPPSNGYSLFTVETLPLLSHLPNNERLGEVSRRWKKLSEDKKEAYNLKAEERNQEYKRAYSKYLLSLPEDVRKRLEKEDVDKQSSKKKSLPQPSVASPFQVTTPTVDRPLKPVADVFMFIEDKKAEYKKKYPAMDENELHRFMVKEFNCISERDKAKYKKMAEQERERLAKESAQSLNNSLKKIKRVPFEGEPVKPSHSGYQLFSKEMLVQLRDIRANERLQEIGRRWIALSEEEKRQWNKKKDALWVQYRKDLAKFKRGLSPKDLKRYEEMNAPSGSKKKKKKSKKEEQDEAVDDDSSNDSDKNGGDSDDEDNEAESPTSSDNEEQVDDNVAASDASSDSSDDSDNENAAETNKSDGAVDTGSESEADEEAAVQLTKDLLQDKGSQQVQGKSSRLNASEVYNDDSSDSSSDSDSSDSSS